MPDLREQYAELSERVSRTPLAHDPQSDQMLAALRGALDAIDAFRTLPPWRFWQFNRRYRRMAEACLQAGIERERFSALIREIESL